MMIDRFEQTIKIEIDTLFDQLDVAALTRAANVIRQAEQEGGRVHLTGIGKPAYVAGYIASLLSSTGTPAYFLDGTEAVHGSSGQVMSRDVVIAISNSGETAELLAAVQTVKRNGAKIIGLSKQLTSSLSQLSDVSLCTEALHEGDDLNKPPRASIVKQLVLLQALSILLQEERQLTASEYVKWHPGGAIGQSLTS